MKQTIQIFFCLVLLSYVSAHGYMSKPPARNSAWKFGYSTPINYDLMSLSCGGPSVEARYGCLCGDRGNLAVQPHLNGKYATGVITGVYDQGQVIEITIVITAKHKGWYEFRICNLDSGELDQDCFDEHVLVRSDGAGTKFFQTTSSVETMRYRLPAGLKCNHCVLQWFWETGNSPGAHPERFANCADIRIGPASTVSSSTTRSSSTISSSSSTSTTRSSSTMSSSSTLPSSSTTRSSTTRSSSTVSSSSPEPSSSEDSPSNEPTKRTCTSTSTQYNCWPSDCCSNYYQCANGIAHPVQEAPSGTYCYQGSFIHTYDALCKDVTCSLTSEIYPWCGDTLCDATESCSTCPQDCGTCRPRCGDGVCQGAETCASCKADCGSCGTPETSSRDSTSMSTTSTSEDIPVPKPSSGRKHIGYYTNWAQYRGIGGKKYAYFPENIDASLFTHICYAFAKVSSTYEVQPFEWNDESTDWSKGMFERFNEHVKTQNPNVKTLLSIGGYGFNEKPETRKIFTNMVKSRANRETFIRSAISYAQKWGFDGVDIDWEFPAQAAQGGEPADKQGFTNLLRDFRRIIDSREETKDKFILSIAVISVGSTLTNGYEVSLIHQYVDWIGVMSYDLHGTWESTTGIHTALYGNSILTVDASISQWLSLGAPKDKIVMGLGSYGRSFLLTTADTSIGAPASGGWAGDYTQTPGFVSYYEIEEFIAGGAVAHFDAKARSSYAFKENKWVGYDDPRAISEKIDYLIRADLAGAMWWSMDLDNFLDSYPLIRTSAQRLYVSTSEEISAEISHLTSSKRAEVQDSEIKEVLAEILEIDSEMIRILSVDESGEIISVRFVLVQSFTTSTEEIAVKFSTVCGKESSSKDYKLNNIENECEPADQLQPNTSPLSLLSTILCLTILLVN